MVQTGSITPSFVLIFIITIFIHYAESGPLSDAEASLQKDAKVQYLTIHQVTHISRRKRNAENHVVFPKQMVFDMEFNDRNINLRLQKHDFMTGDIHLMSSGDTIKHDMGRKTGVYQDGSRGASFIVVCEDYNIHCTLQGSMMIGTDMWMISPETHTPQLHKAVQRKEADKSKKQIGSVPLPDEIQQIVKSTKYITDVSPRQKRAAPTNCNVVEVYAILDETVWDLYFNQSGRVTADAEQALSQYYMSLYNQADLHFDFVGKIKENFCIRLFLRGMNIQKTKALSWSVPAEISLSGATPQIAFVEAVGGMNECGQDGFNLRTSQSLSVDLFQCFTRKDIVWNEGSRTQSFKAFYRSVCYQFMACNTEFEQYQSAVIESNGDDVEVLLAKTIAQGLGTSFDSSSGCSDDDFYQVARELLIPADELKQRNVWYFSTCTLNNIETYVNALSPSCLTSATITDADYDAFRNQPLAGRVYSWDEQCVNRFGNNSRKCDPTGQNRTFFDDMCGAGIFCTNTEFGNGSCVGVTRPFEGTPCGPFGSYCLKSECNILRGNGENCTDHTKCSSNFSFCDITDFTCKCQSDFYDDDGTGNIGGNCVPKVVVGQPCPQPDACLDANAACNNNNCTCNPGFYEEDEACFRLLCFGDACNNTYQCQGDDVECSGSPSTCRCPSDRYFNTSTGNCDEKKDLGSICEDGQCLVNNSVCDAITGECGCQEGFFDTNNADPAGRCEPKLSLGTICPQTDSCEDVNAECSTRCQCKDGFYNNNGLCERKRCIGESCNNVTDCANDGAECSGWPLTCRCPDSTFLNESTASCDSKLSIGTDCTRPDSCLDSNAACSTTCQCKEGFYNNGGTCERLRSIGETCVNVTACLTTNAECSGTPLLCQCPDGTFLNDTTNSCDSKKDLGNPCEAGQCVEMDSKCDSSSNVCECQEGFFDSDGSGTPGGTCIAKLSLGADCTRPDSCLDSNAECSSTCKCKEGFYNNGGTCERLRSIGETCVNVSACLTTNAECSGTPLLCQCPDGTFLNDTTNTCDTKKDLGSPCEAGQCVEMDSKCDSSSNVCECQEGFFDSDGSGTPGGTCNAKLSLGTDCTRPDSCLDSNAECSTTCQCKEGFYNNGGTCERLRSIGETCVNVTACLTTNAECAGTPLLCQCPDGTFLNDTTNTCDTKKDLGSPCEDGQCEPMNSVCDSTSNVCECQEGFFDSDGSGTPGGTCNAKLGLGEACTQADSCSDINAECSTRCQCKDGFYNNGGTCERLRSIGETCVNVTACLTTNAECAGTPLLCQCPDGTFLNDTTNTCDTKKDLGSSCENGQCEPMNSVCDSTSNVCECQEGFFDSDGSGTPGGTCDAKLGLGEACTQADSCSDSNAECSTRCQCKDGFYNNGGTCERLRSIGETCVNVTACLTTNAECAGTPLLCQCPDGTFLNDTTNTCDSKKDLGSPCEDGQCEPMNSVCDSTSNVCECQEGFFDSDGSGTPGGTCDAKLGLGEACTQADSCSDSNAECSTRCQCKDGFYNNSGTCERLRSIGESCVNVTACLTTNAECAGTPLLCQCSDGSFLNDTTNSCDTKKDLGSPCEDGQCEPMNSVCDSTSNVCECQEGFFDSDGSGTPGGTCDAKLGLGEACTQADSCSDSNAECSTRCQCKDGFYNDGGTCERLRSIGETCINVTACLTTNAECAGTPLLCQCPDGTFLNDTTNTCDTKKDLGSPCEDGQCEPMNSVCDSTSNVCECQEGFFDSDGSGTPGGTCDAKLGLGEACTQADSCSDSNAECSTRCQCKDGFYNNGGTCDRLRSIGESCVNVTACLTTNAECAGTPLLCQCPDGTFLNDTTNTCDTKKDLGSPCEDGQCEPMNSVCDSTSNVCECQEGFFDSDGSGTPGGTCDAKLGLGDACTQADSCSDPNAECSTNCQCKDGFFNNGGTCGRQSGIGESCVNVSGCLTPGAECSGSPLTCRCPDDSFLNVTDGTCDAKKGLNSTCEAGQCVDPNAVCQPLTKTCGCGDGFVENNGVCGFGCPVGFESFNTSCYFFGTTEQFYSAARSECSGFSTSSLTSSLVQVDTTEELNYIKNFILSRATQPANGYWNDLFETTTNGNETWRTTGDPLVISDWNPPQPDDRNEIQLCTMFFKQFNYEQADIECFDAERNLGRDNRPAFALCEINLTQK